MSKARTGPSLAPHRRLIVALIALACASTGAGAETYVRGSERDPMVRSANFLGAEQRYYSAVSELLQAGPPTDESRRALADLQLSLGMHDRALSGFGEAQDAVPDDPSARARARLRLAQFEYQRGYLDEARASLMRVRASLPRELRTQWADLYARVLMAQGRHNEAVEVLDAVDVREDPNGFLRYNLGIALIADGRGADGRALLDRVGRLESDDPLTVALRDKANVTLGWHFLQQQLGGAARPFLLRVRSQGPFANRALLGLGWAELSPAGRGESRAALGIEPQAGGRLRNDPRDPLSGLSPLGVLMRNAPLEEPEDRREAGLLLRDTPEQAEDQGLRRALVPWAELLDRDSDDPAVQEAWLAVPFVLDKLGARVQALQYYEQAAQRLEAARARTAAAIDAVRGGRMAETLAHLQDQPESGWTWELRVLPDAPETYFLQTLIAEHAFAETLKNDRDLRMLRRSLDAWRARLDGMEAALRTAATAPADADALVLQARRRRPPLRSTPLQLIADGRLSRPGLYAQPLGPVPLEPVVLQAGGVPEAFNSPADRVQTLRLRLDALIPALDSARSESARQLRRQAYEELAAQKQRIDRYRAEAHFALARLHDRVAPVPDQDERDLK